MMVVVMWIFRYQLLADTGRHYYALENTRERQAAEKVRRKIIPAY